MPGDPHQCRLNAARCSALARRSRMPEVKQNFRAVALTWKQLAAETEADEALLRVDLRNSIWCAFRSIAPGIRTSVAGCVISGKPNREGRT